MSVAESVAGNMMFRISPRIAFGLVTVVVGTVLAWPSHERKLHEKFSEKNLIGRDPFPAPTKNKLGFENFRIEKREEVQRRRYFDPDEFTHDDFLALADEDKPLFDQWWSIRESYLANRIQGLGYNHPIQLGLGEGGIPLSDELKEMLKMERR